MLPDVHSVESQIVRRDRERIRYQKSLRNVQNKKNIDPLTDRTNRMSFINNNFVVHGFGHAIVPMCRQISDC